MCACVLVDGFNTASYRCEAPRRSRIHTMEIQPNLKPESYFTHVRILVDSLYCGCIGMIHSRGKIQLMEWRSGKQEI